MVKENIAIKLTQDSCHRAIGADSNRYPNADSEFQRVNLVVYCASISLIHKPQSKCDEQSCSPGCWNPLGRDRCFYNAFHSEYWANQKYVVSGGLASLAKDEAKVKPRKARGLCFPAIIFVVVLNSPPVKSNQNTLCKSLWLRLVICFWR